MCFLLVSVANWLSTAHGTQNTKISVVLSMALLKSDALWDVTSRRCETYYWPTDTSPHTGRPESCT
jgi:hypothetical protein